MATRVSKNIQFSGQKLIDFLREGSGKREINTKLIGLQRDLALSDLPDPSKALNNILESISNLETAEKQQYGGPYNSVDWDVTRDFLDEGVGKDFLSQLSGVSYAGGDELSITPRLRIYDKLSLLNSFYGEGSFSNLHNGPDAQFYKPPLSSHIGYIKFLYDIGTGSVTVSSLVSTDGSTTLLPSSILNGQTSVVLDLEEYEITSGNPISIRGVGISLNLSSSLVWTVSSGQNSVSSIIASIGGVGNLPNIRFKLTRPYTLSYPPLWFTESPTDSAESGRPGSADDLEVSTSNRVLYKDGNNILPLVYKGYWYSRAYVESRWTQGERDLLGVDSGVPVVCQDSNMRWQKPPTPLKSQSGNWGVRWDGYLRITSGIYAFEVQTNVLVKIDLAIGSGGSWVNLFDTRTSLKESTDKYISNVTFNTDNVSSTYKYVTDSGWVGFVPVTIRMFHGQTDRANPTIIAPSEPNLFIKTTSFSSAKSFFNNSYTVTLSGSDGAWSVTSSSLSSIISLLQNTTASVTYSITGTASGNIFPTPITIYLTTNGTTVSSVTTTGLSPGSYILKVSPYRSTEFTQNLTALWKGRIASPPPGYKKYSDLTSGTYTPDLHKVSFDYRPDWWKITSGNPYTLSTSPTKTNNPLDGLLNNKFKSDLKSLAPGIGLYGTGNGTTFSSKPNIICGESRYSPSDQKGSNYTSIRLVPNNVGEGGKLIVNSLPINNSTFSDSFLLGASDLGGSPNHLTAGNTGLISYTARLYLRTTSSPTNLFNSYYLSSDPTSVTSSNDPTQFGLPAFSSDLWLSPITVFVVRVADDSNFTTNVKSLVSPLNLILSKVTVNGYNLLQFSTTQASILTGGSETSQFTSKYIQFYTENNMAFQYSRVDSGESLSFSDCLKLTFTGGVFQPAESEIPRPISDRVVPFGFDKAEFTKGLCYPPYVTSNTLLSSIAVNDTALYSSALGNYDMFWGDPTKSGLGDKTLTVTENIEFQSYDGSAIEQLASAVPLQAGFFTHKMKIEFPLSSSLYDEDVLEYIGNGEKVKDLYYVFVKLDS